MRIGIVSDTHDRVLSSLHAELADVEEILHAGDVATTETLAEIETIAPVTAVRGNMDERPLADRLPEELVLERGAIRIALVHGHRVGRASVDDLAMRYEARGVDLVIWGHPRARVRAEGGDSLLQSRDGRRHRASRDVRTPDDTRRRLRDRPRLPRLGP